MTLTALNLSESQMGEPHFHSAAISGYRLSATIIKLIDEALKAFTDEPGINVRYSNQGAHITFEDFLLSDFGKSYQKPTGGNSFSNGGLELKCQIKL